MSIRTYFENIANAIKNVYGTTDTLTPAEMPQAITNFGSIFQTKELSSPIGTETTVEGCLSSLSSDLSGKESKWTDSEWQTTGYSRYKKFGRNVSISVSLGSDVIPTGQWVDVGTLPDGYKPMISERTFAVFGPASNIFGYLLVSPTGTIYIRHEYGQNIGYGTSSISFITEQ